MKRRTLLQNLFSSVVAAPMLSAFDTRITLVDAGDERQMKRAIQLAGNVPKYPFGALLVDQKGIVVAEGWNRSVHNPTWHGEMDAINKCAASNSKIDWTSLTLYTTAEPCAMCQGAVAWAGIFDGNVDVNGTLFKSAGAFRIDHPLDPENKYLSHSFVESPDMKNIYDGVAVLDAAGEAIVTLPDWFEALNQDFRYQLTPMGAAFVPYVAEEIAGNQFKIGGGIPGRKVSWQVTGIRHDAYANAHRIQVEELKPSAAMGTYLHPDAFGQPVEKDRPAVDDFKATAKDSPAAIAAGPREELRARLRAISQKPEKQ